MAEPISRMTCAFISFGVECNGSIIFVTVGWNNSSFGVFQCMVKAFDEYIEYGKIMQQVILSGMSSDQQASEARL